MGNCVRKSNQISAAQDEIHEQDTKVSHQMKSSSSSSSSLAELEKTKREHGKRVRFEEQDHGVGKGSGAMRIRIVVTKEELKRMLMNENRNDTPQVSLKQLLIDMKLKVKRVSKIEENDSWRPALESIPEDRSFKI